MSTLGLGISAKEVHAVVVHRGRILWAAAAGHGGPADLADVIARLAAECPAPPRAARIALARDVAQVRTIDPAPRLRGAALKSYVALEAPRLFRHRGEPLISDARAIRRGGGAVLRAAAAAEPLPAAALEGCAQAGLLVEAVCPASDVLRHATAQRPSGGAVVIATESGDEIIELDRGIPWRSRLQRAGSAEASLLAPALVALGERGPAYAAAYAVAVGRPVLQLLPSHAAAARRLRDRHRRRLVGAAAAACWLLAAAVALGRQQTGLARVRAELRTSGPMADSLLAVRADLDQARDAIQFIARREAERSRSLELLASLTVAMTDSTVVAGLRIDEDSTIRITGYAGSAAHALAAVERVPRLSSPRFEAPTSRELITGGGRMVELERFAIVARLGSRL